MTQTSGNVIGVFTEDQAARLTGVSRRQLAEWSRNGFFKPEHFADRGRNFSRLYSFRDLVCLKVLSQLRNARKIPMAHLKEVKSFLSHLGDHVWTGATLYVLGKKVVFEDPATGDLEEVGSKQKVLQIPLRLVASDMQAEVKKLNRRDEAEIGKFERNRGVAQNQLVIAGTRIPVRSVKAFADAGYTPAQIVAEYPTLTEADVRAVIDAKDEAA
ncbi:DUF433 domain-containing protein [Mesorhizobium sp. CAU 1741]|uniref:DUF433 domain-containing protein n=1 Tax=Mesorhizobium sp. CAU 1741 TaxID=3140366 RepID=UPI00325B5FB1